MPFRPPKQQAAAGSAQKSPLLHELEMSRFFRYLCIVEICVASLIGIGAVCGALYLPLWVFFGLFPSVHGRFMETIHAVHSGWRVILILLVPLFFRPLFKFLIHLKEGPFNTRSEIPPKTETGSATEGPYGNQSEEKGGK
jgi:hypothetical protein